MAVSVAREAVDGVRAFKEWLAWDGDGLDSEARKSSAGISGLESGGRAAARRGSARVDVAVEGERLRFEPTAGAVGSEEEVGTVEGEG